jgi:hypothetical protein
MPLKPYRGAYRKLVLAFDVGTTFSGVGYAILDPGEVPKIHGVTRYMIVVSWNKCVLILNRFPGQENGDHKIPTILWYTKEGQVRAAGAEAGKDTMIFAAEKENLIFVEW